MFYLIRIKSSNKIQNNNNKNNNNFNYIINNNNNKKNTNSKFSSLNLKQTLFL